MPKPLTGNEALIEDTTPIALRVCLEYAVPLWIAEYRRRGGPVEADYERARALGSVLAEQGDVLFVRGPPSAMKKGDPEATTTAKLFNRIADALAVGAFCPGGSRFGSQRWSAMEGR